MLFCQSTLQQQHWTEDMTWLGLWKRFTKQINGVLLWIVPAFLNICGSTGDIFVPPAVRHLLSLHIHREWLTQQHYTLYSFLRLLYSKRLWVCRGLISECAGLHTAMNHHVVKFCQLSVCPLASLISCRGMVMTVNKASARFVIPCSFSFSIGVQSKFRYVERENISPLHSSHSSSLISWNCNPS